MGIKFMKEVGEGDQRVCKGEKQVIRIGRELVLGVSYLKVLDVWVVYDFTYEWLQ